MISAYTYEKHAGRHGEKSLCLPVLCGVWALRLRRRKAAGYCVDEPPGFEYNWTKRGRSVEERRHWI